MKPIDYFKLCAKNLLRDYTAEFGPRAAGEWTGRSRARFFDIPAIAMEFDLDTGGNLTLMQAQHVIAQMVGTHSWGDLIHADDAELERRRKMLDMGAYKLAPCRIYSIDLSKCPRVGDAGPRGDYLVRCAKTPELMEIIGQKPNCLFLSVRLTDSLCAEIESDDRHLYVNVCPEWNEIRVFVPGSDWNETYAVGVKNI